MSRSNISVAFTINNNYAQHCCVAIISILTNNSTSNFSFYIISDDLTDETKDILNRTVDSFGGNSTNTFIDISQELCGSMNINIGYITYHTYIRFFLSYLLPHVDKVLYLDSDLIINGSIKELWDTHLGNNYCAAVKDNWIESINYKNRIGLKKEDTYINAGVLLLNLKKIREDNISEKLISLANQLKDKIKFQDQDIINICFLNKITLLPGKYNCCNNDIVETPVIIHFNGKIKPWALKEKCRSPYKKIYLRYLKNSLYKKNYKEIKRSETLRTIKKIMGQNVKNKKIKVALIIDEYFGACGTAFGGYGFLSRAYIAKYIPDENIEIEVILSNYKRKRWSFKAIVEKVDGVKVIIPPGKKFVKQWVNKQNYDLYLTVELTHGITKFDKKGTPVIHWIQDPRPWGEWKEIETVKLYPEDCYWNSELYDLVNLRNKQGLVTFVSQGYFLNPLAKELYRLPEETPIKYLPNPIDIDYEFDPSTYKKKNSIIFIGRIESVKRGWLFCEIAKRMPEYEFYMIGQSFRERSKNESIMNDYSSGISNLHFTGHLEGEEKMRHIRDAKILVNTSIHEALPITFLEALAYGTLLVSNRDPENLTSKFGRYVGPVLGDGFDKIDLYVDAIRELLKDEKEYTDLSCKAVEYIREIHPVDKFQDELRKLITDTVNKKR